MPPGTGSGFARATAEQTKQPSWSRRKWNKVAWKDCMMIQVTVILGDVCAPSMYVCMYLSILFLYFPFTLLFGRLGEGKGEGRKGLKQEKQASLWFFRADWLACLRKLVHRPGEETDLWQLMHLCGVPRLQYSCAVGGFQASLPQHRIDAVSQFLDVSLRQFHVRLHEHQLLKKQPFYKRLKAAANHARIVPQFSNLLLCQRRLLL